MSPRSRRLHAYCAALRLPALHTVIGPCASPKRPPFSRSPAHSLVSGVRCPSHRARHVGLPQRPAGTCHLLLPRHSIGKPVLRARLTENKMTKTRLCASVTSEGAASTKFMPRGDRRTIYSCVSETR